MKRQNPFKNPYALQKQMDPSSGTLNQSCMEHMRKIERESSNSGWISSKRSVTRARGKVEQIMEELVSFEMVDSSTGIDGITFGRDGSYEKILSFILRIH